MRLTAGGSITALGPLHRPPGRMERTEAGSPDVIASLKFRCSPALYGIFLFGLMLCFSHWWKDLPLSFPATRAGSRLAGSRWGQAAAVASPDRTRLRAITLSQNGADPLSPHVLPGRLRDREAAEQEAAGRIKDRLSCQRGCGQKRHPAPGRFLSRQLMVKPSAVSRLSHVTCRLKGGGVEVT